ncbi:MAG: hypothetical protein PHF86_04345 [Candidatus Nanoarchaeia archaeon]|nr:hypothetical protein [Candidatus Nanoarchaeia archaeon]
MSLPIRDTPILAGEDARKFIKNMQNPKPVPRKEYERAKKIYEELKAKGKLDI